MEANSDHQLGLADMPGPWLLLLADALDTPSRLATFKTCTAMRDNILAQCSVQTQFSLPLHPEQAASAQAALVRACQRSRCTALRLVRTAGAQAGPEAAPMQAVSDIRVSDASAHGLLFGALASMPGGGGLKTIIHTLLAELELDSLVPHWLLSTCPNLTTLTLDNCQFSALPAATDSIPACGQLRQLHITGLACDINEQSNFSRWQHQLRALPGLQHLSLHVLNDNVAQTIKLCSVVGAQLTSLKCEGPLFYEVPPQAAAWYPNLCELHVPTLTVEDLGMQALLSLPSLKHMECFGFELEDSYTQRPCAWTRLHCGLLDIDQFARVPLHSIQWLAPVPDAATLFSISTSYGAQTTSSVVAAIGRCGGIRWGGTHTLRLTVFWPASLEAMFPLLSGCQAHVLNVSGHLNGHWPMTVELLTALQPVLANQHLTQVEFRAFSWMHEGVLCLLLPCIPPHIRSIRLDATIVVATEQQLTVICSNACRPIEVSVQLAEGQWAAGWQERVRAAMPEARRQHVLFI